MTTACTVHYKLWPQPIDLAALTRVIAQQDRPAILGGNTSVERFSVFAAEPNDYLAVSSSQPGPLEIVCRTLQRYSLDQTVNRPDSCTPMPGWIGYLSYDLARHIERLPNLAKDDIPMPLVYLAFYPAVIVYDHRRKQTWLAAASIERRNDSSEQLFAKMEDWLRQAQSISAKSTPDTPDMNGGPMEIDSTLNIQQYFKALYRIHHHIIDGDVYQINFSLRWQCFFDADPAELFLWQNTHNPSPYAAYIKTADWAIVSASPELFLRIDGQTILTRPIKGTRRRQSGIQDIAAREFNRQQYEQLLHSPKDAAELMMITDLERNDLARVCIPGSRHVKLERTVEAYPTVFHAFSEIEGQLPYPCDASLFIDILRAIFPGGSITGAPKIRAMEIIEQLEPTRRGVYTGCVGHIGLDWNASFNIAIRTIIICDGMAYIQTGGGIVADSDPAEEWQETQIKADALLAGVKAVQKTGRSSV